MSRQQGLRKWEVKPLCNVATHCCFDFEPILERRSRNVSPAMFVFFFGKLRVAGVARRQPLVIAGGESP
jgi:hypothetical protein